jgi:hypothetical protein
MRLSARFTICVMAVAVPLGMAACGGGGDDDVTIEGTDHTYVVDTVTIPLDQNQADDLGFNLDGNCQFGDNAIDNQLGNILVALRAAAGGGSLDLQGSIDDAIDEGSILLLANIRATSLAQATNAGFFLYLGDNPSPAPCTDPTDITTCRQHLDGNGSFSIAANSPTDVAVGGNILPGGRFQGGPGTLTLQIAFGNVAINLQLIEARAEVTGITADGFGTSKVGGAVPNAVIQDQVIPAVFQAIDEIMLEDCGPVANRMGDDCSCGDSTGGTLMDIFDEEPEGGDCQVTLPELRANQLIQTLLRPDVDTDCDGTEDALSVGVGATGVKASFTVP